MSVVDYKGNKITVSADQVQAGTNEMLDKYIERMDSNGYVTTRRIADGAVTSNKLTDGVVGYDKLSTEVSKDISAIKDYQYADKEKWQTVENELGKKLSLPYNGENDMNNALTSGIYPYCILGRPVGSTGYYTCVVLRSSDADGDGYFSIEQTAYGRTDELGRVFKRMVYWKSSSDNTFLDWVEVTPTTPTPCILWPDTPTPDEFDSDGHAAYLAFYPGKYNIWSYRGGEKQFTMEDGDPTMQIYTTNHGENWHWCPVSVDLGSAVGTIGTSKIADGAVTHAKLGDQVILANNIESSAVELVHLDRDLQHAYTSRITSSSVGNATTITNRSLYPWVAVEYDTDLLNVFDFSSESWHIGTDGKGYFAVSLYGVEECYLYCPTQVIDDDTLNDSGWANHAAVYYIKGDDTIYYNPTDIEGFIDILKTICGSNTNKVGVKLSVTWNDSADQHVFTIRETINLDEEA